MTPAESKEQAIREKYNLSSDVEIVEFRFAGDPSTMKLFCYHLNWHLLHCDELPPLQIYPMHNPPDPTIRLYACVSKSKGDFKKFELPP